MRTQRHNKKFGSLPPEKARTTLAGSPGGGVTTGEDQTGARVPAFLPAEPEDRPGGGETAPGDVGDALRTILGCADRIARTESIDQARDYARAIRRETYRAFRRGEEAETKEEYERAGNGEETDRTDHGGTFAGPPFPPAHAFREITGAGSGALADRINGIREALAAGDEAAMRAEALALRARALERSAGPLAEEALRLERALREDRTADAEAAFAGIELCYRALLRAAPERTPPSSSGA